MDQQARILNIVRQAAGKQVDVVLVAADPRLAATVVQTVGVKGWDGFALIVVTGGRNGQHNV